MSLAATDPDSIAGPVTVIVLLTGSTIFLFGYVKAVMDRANVDYKKTKESLPGMRKAYWQAWWRAVKIGFFIALGVVCLIVWMVNDPAADATPRPSPSVRSR